MERMSNEDHSEKGVGKGEMLVGNRKETRHRRGIRGDGKRKGEKRGTPAPGLG